MRDRGDDADTQRLEALGDVVFEPLDLRDLDALRLHDLVERHGGADRGLDTLNGDTEIAERILDLGLVLENLLVAHFRVGNIVFEQRHGRLVVVHEVFQRVVALGRDRLFVDQAGFVGLDGHDDAPGRNGYLGKRPVGERLPGYRSGSGGHPGNRGHPGSRGRCPDGIFPAQG